MKNNPWYYTINKELIKKQKPCFDGDYVHIKSFTGCFRVNSVHLDYFTVIKNREVKNIPWDYFICLNGHGVSEEALLKRKLKSLSETIKLNIDKQVMINDIILTELKNLRKTFA